MAPFTVRRVPLNYCAMHRQVGVWAEDGTTRWHCPECISDATYFASAVMRLDRVLHDENHRTRRVASCPLCNAGGVA